MVRKPIFKSIEIAANLITLGKFNEIKKNLNYDHYFHLFSEMYCVNPSTEGNSGGKTLILLEKNQRVNVVYGRGGGLQGKEEGINISLNKKLTVKDYIVGGEKYGGSHFYIYDAVNANCQIFQVDLLKGNGLWKESYKSFILQDVTNAVPSYLVKFAKGATDFAAKVDIALHGKGLKNKYGK